MSAIIAGIGHLVAEERRAWRVARGTEAVGTTLRTVAEQIVVAIRRKNAVVAAVFGLVAKTWRTGRIARRTSAVGTGLRAVTE